MDIHKPKAAHSWREFAIEIGTIIAGILIALALEQAVEAHHWSQQVKDAHVALRSEVSDQMQIYAQRIAVHPCVERRLREIEAVLDDLDHGRHVASVADFSRPLGGSYYDGAWRSLGGAGVLSHLPTRELVAYGKLYAVSANVTSWSTMGGQDWSTIKLVVGDANRLTGADRSAIRVAMNHTRALEYTWTVQGARQIERTRQLGISIPAAPDVSHTPECLPLQRG